MSEIENKNEESWRDELSVGGQRFLDLLLLVGAPFGLPGIRMIFKGNRLKPKKWFWMLVGLAQIVSVAAFFTMIDEFPPIIVFSIIVVIYSVITDKEYVIKYNVMLRNGYFRDMERKREADRIRQEQTWQHQAEKAMDKTMVTDSRERSAKQIKRPQPQREIPGADTAKAIPPAESQPLHEPRQASVPRPTPKPLSTPKPAAQPKAQPQPAPAIKPEKDPYADRRRLDL